MKGFVKSVTVPAGIHTWVPLLGAAVFAAALCSCGVTAVPPGPDDALIDAIRRAVNEVSSDSMVSVLNAINEDRSGDSPAAPKVRLWLIDTLDADGYVVTTMATGDPATWIPRADNIVAVKPGADPSLAPMLITAHWDTVPGTHGLDDNGSGVAAVLELARIFKDRTFARSVRFILFANEEMNIDGSSEYVATLSDAALPAFVLNFESIAYTPDAADPIGSLFGQKTGDWIAVCAPDWSAAPLCSFEVAARAFAPSLKYVSFSCPADYKKEVLLQAIQLSDQDPFWVRGVPALMTTDAPPLRNPNYHTVNDTLESLNVPFMTDVVKASLATACIEAQLVP